MSGSRRAAFPDLRLDRAGIAFLGGAAMIALGPLSLEEAFRAIDFDTIALLLGMMIVVAHLKVSGAFRALGGLAIDHAHAPFVLLVIVTVLAGVLSAFLVNDAICLVMAPIVLQVVRALDRNPLALSHRGRDRLQLRQRRDDHRQSAEHGDRHAVEDPLSRLRRRARAGRRLRPCRRNHRGAPRLRSGIRVQERARAHLFRGHMHKGQVVKASVTCLALAIAFFAGVLRRRRRFWAARSCS